MAKTWLQHLLTATALNFVRADAWLADRTLAQTHRSPGRHLRLTATSSWIRQQYLSQ